MKMVHASSSLLGGLAMAQQCDLVSLSSAPGTSDAEPGENVDY